jgi:hypothetical protein
MTTAFQTVIDNAETISINRRRKVAQTVARDGTVKSTSLGGQIWEFEVKLPDGPKWTEYRSLIEGMEALDRTTVGTIQINAAGHSWLSGYQGDLGSTSGISVSFSSGNTVTIIAGATGLTTGQFRFRAGDFIQLGSSGSVYSVVSDVAHNGTTITLNRPVREAAGTYSLIVGQSVTWDIICVQFPKWTIFARDQISWDGPFVFAEAI